MEEIGKKCKFQQKQVTNSILFMIFIRKENKIRLSPFSNILNNSVR